VKITCVTHSHTDCFLRPHCKNRGGARSVRSRAAKKGGKTEEDVFILSLIFVLGFDQWDDATTSSNWQTAPTGFCGVRGIQSRSQSRDLSARDFSYRHGSQRRLLSNAGRARTRVCFGRCCCAMFRSSVIFSVSGRFTSSHLLRPVCGTPGNKNNAVSDLAVGSVSTYVLMLFPLRVTADKYLSVEAVVAASCLALLARCSFRYLSSPRTTTHDHFLRMVTSCFSFPLIFFIYLVPFQIQH
jgi:hypothetical protein